MISSVYDYYLSQYGSKAYSKYDSHTKTQLKNTYGKVVKKNSQTPTYKTDISEDAQKYAIDLKENARELSNIASELSNEKDGSIAYRRSAFSSNDNAVEALYIGDGSASDNTSFKIEISQLATGQINNGNFLPSNGHVIEPGDYSFDLSINDLTYEFQFGIETSETTGDIQNKISRLINRSGIGLSSTVESDSLGNTGISIHSDSTGLTGIKPTIFNIRANNDSQTNNPDYVEGFDTPTNIKNTSLVETLGLDRVSQYPGNAIFTINGESKTSPANDITINNMFALNFKSVTATPVTVSLQDDADSIVESIEDLVSGYNNLVSVANDEKNTQFSGNEKLKKEISGIAKSFKNELEDNGLSVGDDGTISVDRDSIIKAADEGRLDNVYKTLDSFKNSLQNKAEDISLNPMNYVNNKIVAYKNPNRPVTDPYNLSAYSGMMYNGYT